MAPAVFLFPFIEKKKQKFINFSLPVDGCYFEKIKYIPARIETFRQHFFN